MTLGDDGGLSVDRLTGEAIAPLIAEFAQLRITVFHEWSYLYAGDADYEAWYLERFAKARDAVLVAVRDGGRDDGASSGLPLDQEMNDFQVPFRDTGRDVSTIFYFSESVLLAPYRGAGLGHRFFGAREAHARCLGRFTLTTFCAVKRDPADLRWPAGHRPLDDFWAKRGYRPAEGIVAHFPWTEIGDDTETVKPMQFWTRALD